MGFLLLAFSQISNNAGMLHYTSGGNFSCPMVIRGPGGAGRALLFCRTPRLSPDRWAPAPAAGVGRQLGAEHSQRLESYFQAIPGAADRRAHGRFLRPQRIGAEPLMSRPHISHRAVAPGKLSHGGAPASRRCPARCVQHPGEREGAPEVRHPQRQPGCLLRGAARGCPHRPSRSTTVSGPLTHHPMPSKDLTPPPSRPAPLQHVLLYNVKGVTYDDYCQVRSIASAPAVTPRRFSFCVLPRCLPALRVTPLIVASWSRAAA